MLTAYVLFLSLLIASWLRYAVIGEKFDRALHEADPAYRNVREMGRRLFVDPVGGLRDLPKAYGRYYGVTFRQIDDPIVERLRRRAARAFLDVALVAFGGLLGVLLLAGVLRRIAPGALEVTVIASQVFLVAYWIRGLREHRRETARSPMIVVYMLAGIGTAIGAIAIAAILWSRAG